MLPLHADEEKEYVRSAMAALLFADPSRRVALQLTLLLTNIARFDAPRPWESLLPALAAAAAPGGGLPPAGRQRALKALKFVLSALQGGWEAPVCCARSARGRATSTRLGAGRERPYAGGACIERVYPS